MSHKILKIVWLHLENNTSQKVIQEILENNTF